MYLCISSRNHSIETNKPKKSVNNITHLTLITRNLNGNRKMTEPCKETLKRQFPVFHSRAMKREYIHQFGRVTGVKSGLLREAYRRLTGDQSAINNQSEAVLDG